MLERFAIKLPGRSDDGAAVWLPIDAKFPREDYERLLEAQNRSDAPGAESAAKAMEARIRLEAKTIAESYLAPPHTTDFAILFLPVEGLYAEVLRRPGLMDALQRDFRVTLAGPTTLLAILNSLHMGFRTLALEKQASEVWKVLGAVKTEFDRYGEWVAKVREQVQKAADTLDKRRHPQQANASRFESGGSLARDRGAGAAAFANGRYVGCHRPERSGLSGAFTKRVFTHA